MPAPHTFSKGLSEAQFDALDAARRKAGLSLQELKDRVLRDFCESHGVEWPSTAQHGGLRRYIQCPRCGQSAAPAAEPKVWLCECGLYNDANGDTWVQYEIIDGQRVERDHKNTGW